MIIRVKLYNYGKCDYIESFIIKKEYEDKKDSLKEKYDNKYIIYNEDKKKYLKHFVQSSGKPIFTEKLENAKLFDNIAEAYINRKKMIEYAEQNKDNKNISSIIYNKNNCVNIDVSQIIFIE